MSPTTHTPDHDRIDELLSGYALRSLSGPDAREADRLLAEHVPDCARCRATLASFTDLGGDLALAAEPLEPPDLVLARLRREISEPAGVTRPGRTGPRWARGAWLAAAASVVALVAVSGLAISMGDRATRAEDLGSGLANVLDTVRNGGEADALEGEGGRPDLVEVTAPDLERLSLYGTDVPEPGPGHVYRAWLGSPEGWTLIREFVPTEDGWVVLNVAVDPSHYDEIVICEEPAGTPPTTPGYLVRWQATLGP